MPKALGIIRDEHRTIAAILHGMEYLVREVRAHRKAVDPGVFHAMLYYLDTFAQRVHHPKEDEFLFRPLKVRSEEAARVIAVLEAEHAAGEESLRKVAQAMIRYEEGGEKELAGFERAVDNFVEGYRNHIRREEDELFPLALAVLNPRDWIAIDGAMEGHTDPLSAAREEKNFDKLFNRIVNIAPPPIGVGPAASADISRADRP